MTFENSHQPMPRERRRCQQGGPSASKGMSKGTYLASKETYLVSKETYLASKETHKLLHACSKYMLA